MLVQRTGMPLWTFEPPATLPLADVLRQVDQALDRDNAKPWRLRVHLSGALCPPVAFVVPTGVKRHVEVFAIAQASATQVWGVPVEQAAEIVCSVDGCHDGLAASMLAGTHQMIAQWAAGNKGRLIGLRPLWAVATAARACVGQQVTGLAVVEPDALTVLSLQPTNAVRVRSWAGRYAAADAMARLSEMSDPADETRHRTDVAMVFNPAPMPNVWAQGPSIWVKHWSALR